MEESRYGTTTLTTIAPDKQAIARIAVDSLVERLACTEVAEPRRPTPRPPPGHPRIHRPPPGSLTGDVLVRTLQSDADHQRHRSVRARGTPRRARAFTGS
ncbi:hypothetical protein EES43_01490 [Streptomyces sp. ADI96-02]|nr:hypothetical protein EES43_01490 [Streptomyces sp. ADI96-02]